MYLYQSHQIATNTPLHRDISPRIRVWCEDEQLDASFYEFGETEKWLQSAETYCGPYVWKRYDLLVLPPSFPYGGMENPCISFMTPTLLVSVCTAAYARILVWPALCDTYI